jgi:hypothetical protein
LKSIEQLAESFAHRCDTRDSLVVSKEIQFFAVRVKPGDFMTIGMNREANCVALPRFKQSDAPRVAHALYIVLSLHKGIHHGQDDQEPVD